MHSLYINLKKITRRSGKNLTADFGKAVLIVLIFQFLRFAGYSQRGVFVDVSKQQFSGLPQLGNSASAWGDYDNDGRGRSPALWII